VIEHLRFFVDLLFAIGWGVTLHAVANELYWKVEGFSEILKLQGEYIGLVLMLIAYVVLRRLLSSESQKTIK